MDNRLSVQLIDNSPAANLVPSYNADVFKQGIESQRIVEISPNESEPAGYQYQREITFDIPVFPGL